MANQIKWYSGYAMIKPEPAFRLEFNEQKVDQYEKEANDLMNKYGETIRWGRDTVTTVRDKISADHIKRATKGVIEEFAREKERAIYDSIFGKPKPASGTTQTSTMPERDDRDDAIRSIEVIENTLAVIEASLQSEQKARFNADADINELVQMLVKSVDELRAENADLKQRITALEETYTTSNPNFGTF